MIQVERPKTVAGTPKPGALNARLEERFAATERMILVMPWGRTGSFESRRVRLMDCSAHGLGLEDATAMEAGQEFAVYLKLEEVAMVLYRVCHCTRLPSGRYKIGARLAGFLDRREENPDRVLASLLEERLV